MRQLGISGAIAAVLAMACAYILFPPFLRAAGPPSPRLRRTSPGAYRQGTIARRLERFFTARHPLVAALGPAHGRIGRTFVTENRRRGRFILRMREASRSRPRAVVVREIENIVRAQGFRPVLVGGLYALQGELSKLVEGSVIRGLGGLLGAFFVIVLIVTRSFRSALAMGAAWPSRRSRCSDWSVFSACPSTSFRLPRRTLRSLSGLTR